MCSSQRLCCVLWYTLTMVAEPIHGRLAFHALAHHLGATTSSFDFTKALAASEKFPLFITWSKVGPQDELRGCIGTFEGQSLATGIPKFALVAYVTCKGIDATMRSMSVFHVSCRVVPMSVSYLVDMVSMMCSALEDARFPPIAKDELTGLKVTVSLLHHFEDCAHWNDWEIGVHGISMEYNHDGQYFGATFLPSVAKEQGWSQMDTLEQLFRKAGWKQGVTEGMLQAVAVERYQASATSVTYQEYEEWAKTA